MRADAEIQRLAEAALADERARGELQRALDLDDLNFSYFFYLYRSKKEGRAAESLVIHEPGRSTRGAVAFPTPIAPDDLMKCLPCVSHRELAREGYGEAASGAVLWVKKMQAGTGSAMVRIRYLSRLLGIPEREVRVGAKGTDLHVTVGGDRLPLAEVQILQMLLAARRGELGGILFHDIVGPETEESLRRLWAKPCRLDPGRSYRQVVEGTPGLGHAGKLFQSHLPTVNREGKLTFNRTAPGGHALFAVDALRAAFRPGELPDTGGRPLVAAIGNGEDLSSSPSPHMVGWMVRRKIPLVMVTTEKTGVDYQGGQIAVVKSPEGPPYIALIETAQAKESGQLEWFYRLGLEPGQRPALFNTNVALFHYGELVPRMRRLVAELGEDRVMGALMPDLIDKWKSQTDPDGVAREYLQLEGAMGSTLLNLDRLWRSRYGEPLVHFINVDRRERTDFFSPVKNGFDFFMQFHSDRFHVDPATMKLVNARPGELPRVSFKGPTGYWEDVTTMLEAFAGTSIRELDSLDVEGPVGLAGLVLRGRVTVRNPRGYVDVAKALSGRVLENAVVEVGADGAVRITAAAGTPGG